MTLSVQRSDRSGGELNANAQQESRISMEDYSIALVDQLEVPRHHRQRFSVGY